MKCPGTPSRNDIPSTKLPPRPPTFKRKMGSSPVQRSNSCPIPKYLKEMTECRRELLGYAEECVNAQTAMNAARGHYANNIATSSNTGASLRRGALIVKVKCPCGASYQILLFEGICYYKLV
ncbi:hypothetical protein OWV82_006564 [Melia azedarach]|uniref:Uncharacterized protein n=1 Tax=Melia azedarach TaxID=155640 RepID=A0ACC1YJF0_MELAZ|nr:hypothetical protein OWV82_006564 [Melia azedarach]